VLEDLYGLLEVVEVVSGPLVNLVEGADLACLVVLAGAFEGF
jgi:hypothetical protein